MDKPPTNGSSSPTRGKAFMENIRLLMVDDETDFLQPISKRMKKRGIIPELANSGEQCLAILERKPVEVVVSDIKMPGMDGFRLLKTIKEKFPHIEVILLTGQGSIQDGVEGIKAGAFDYLTKPIEFQELLEKIRQAYDKILTKRKKEKEAELRIVQLQEDLSRRMQSEKLDALGRLAAGVAHEINNPLTGILLYCNMILEKLEKNHPLEQNIKYVIEDANRCKEIVKNLLACCRRKSHSMERFELNDLVIESLRSIEDQGFFLQIAVSKELAEYSIPVRGDKNQLAQAVVNLITNAVDAMENKGKITFRTYRDNTSGMACLEVEDTGAGISTDRISKVFDPFFTTKIPGKGTGLGLSAVHGIVKENNGRISVKETGHKGTVFLLELPERYVNNDDLIG